MRSHLFINGEWVKPARGGTFPVVNPATEEVFHHAPAATQEDVDLAVRSARNAFESWSKTTGQQRAVYLRNVAKLINERKDALAQLETKDGGKPLKEALADMSDTATCFEYYADLAEKLDKRQNTPVELPDPSFKCHLRYEPVGVVGAIIPWNYPIMMAAWKLAPALAAGCTIVLKPSEYTPLTALELAAITKDAGLPNGVFNVITGYGPDAGQPLAEHPGIDKIAFTGSIPTGSRLMGIAAKGIKRCTLELGGKSPIIVFDDADLEMAVDWVMFGIFINQGEVCSATSRLLVQEGIASRLLACLAEETPKIVLGDGLDPKTQMGPLVAEQQYKRVTQYIQKGIEEGARLLVGGKRPAHLAKGYFVEPTIFTDVKDNMTIWREEIFGPVLSVRTFKTEDEAVRVANDTYYGLAAAVLSKDMDKCTRVANSMRAGVVWINCSQPAFAHAPWGGYKQSGIGRELGEAGLDTYLEIKQVTTYLSDQPFGWYKPNL
jgi:betaine-aldehyde dehydrogenase